tara:strand:+ start:151 stop:261 length:111 start_codon:yes stop_codon:yes gene_type:complete
MVQKSQSVQALTKYKKIEREFVPFKRASQIIQELEA